MRIIIVNSEVEITEVILRNVMTSHLPAQYKVVNPSSGMLCSSFLLDLPPTIQISAFIHSIHRGYSIQSTHPFQRRNPPNCAKSPALCSSLQISFFKPLILQRFHRRNHWSPSDSLALLIPWFKVSWIFMRVKSPLFLRPLVWTRYCVLSCLQPL